MKEYSTTDIVLAATLKCSKYNLIRIDLQDSKGIFVFANVDETFLSNFNLGNASVEPITFNNNIRQLTTSVRRMKS